MCQELSHKWLIALDFTTEYPQFVAENNAMGFLSEDGGESYNLCHCASPIYFELVRSGLIIYPTRNRAVWSNFEIADMDFWRGEAYSKFFEYLDATGGFYYEVLPTFALYMAPIVDAFILYLKAMG